MRIFFRLLHDQLHELQKTKYILKFDINLDLYILIVGKDWPLLLPQNYCVKNMCLLNIERSLRQSKYTGII